MLKRISMTLAIACLPVAAMGCTIDSVSTTQVDLVLRKQGGLQFAKYQEVCEKLRSVDAGVEIHGLATVLQGKSIAWSVIFITDRNSRFAVGDASYTSTQTNDNASMDVAEALLYKGVISGISDWDVDAAIRILEKKRQHLKPAKSAPAEMAI